MAKAVFVKKAQRAVPEADIAIGDSYYWWKFKNSGKHFSKTPPRRSQLTQSAFYSTLYDIEDAIGDLEPNSELQSMVEDLASQLRELGDECQGNLENMPEGLQQGDTGQMLQERADACGAAADELESIDMSDFEVDEKQTAEVRKTDKDAEEVNDEGCTEEEYWQGRLDEVQGISIDAP